MQYSWSLLFSSIIYFWKLHTALANRDEFRTGSENQSKSMDALLASFWYAKKQNRLPSVSDPVLLLRPWLSPSILFTYLYLWIFRISCYLNRILAGIPKTPCYIIVYFHLKVNLKIQLFSPLKNLMIWNDKKKKGYAPTFAWVCITFLISVKSYILKLAHSVWSALVA